jgi:hypothetical protein
MKEPLAHLLRMLLPFDERHLCQRVAYLTYLCSEPVHEDKNLARYLVDHLLRHRYVKTAKAVTESAGIEVRQRSVLAKFIS